MDNGLRTRKEKFFSRHWGKRDGKHITGAIEHRIRITAVSKTIEISNSCTELFTNEKVRV